MFYSSCAEQREKSWFSLIFDISFFLVLSEQGNIFIHLILCHSSTSTTHRAQHRLFLCHHSLFVRSQFHRMLSIYSVHFTQQRKKPFPFDTGWKCIRSFVKRISLWFHFLSGKNHPTQITWFACVWCIRAESELKTQNYHKTLSSVHWRRIPFFSSAFHIVPYVSSFV